MRPSSSYRAARRNSRSHYMKSKNSVSAEMVAEFMGRWNCYPEIPIVREVRRSGLDVRRFGRRNR